MQNTWIVHRPYYLDPVKKMLFVASAERLRCLLGELASAFGLAFNPDSDVREAVSIGLISDLWKRKTRVVTCDLAAISNAREMMGDGIGNRKSPLECLRGADCCVIATEWVEFSRLRPKQFKEVMRTPAMVYRRRLMDPGPFMRGVRAPGVGLGRPAQNVWV